MNSRLSFMARRCLLYGNPNMKLLRIFQTSPGTFIWQSLTYTSCTSRIENATIPISLSNVILRDPFIPQALTPLKPPRNKDNSQSLKKKVPATTIMLPSDMSSRVLHLLVSANLQRLPAVVGYSDTSFDSLYHMERKVFNILSTADTQLKQNQNQRKLYYEKPNKEVAPADDPRQKIRKLELKLRNELPAYFDKSATWHDFAIYTASVELLITPQKLKKKWSFRGVSSYKRVATVYRYLCKLWLREPRLEVLSMVCHKDKKHIEVRWRVAGSPFYLQIISFLLPIARNRLIKYYDYMSILYVNDHGKIWKHDISKLRPSPSPLVKELVGMRKNLQAAAMSPFAKKGTT